MRGRWFPAWGAAIELGDVAPQTVEGRDPTYDLNLLARVREQTLAELRKRDDNRFPALDKTWGRGPMNNCCKWFHVPEHESKHNGQINHPAMRLPGAEPSNEWEL